MTDRERWRKVRRAPGYKVSSLGRVKSPGGLLSPFPDRDGYLRVSLRDELVFVHRLVLEAFHGPRPYGTEGLHGPGGRQDNRAIVLRWGTHRENEQDKRKWKAKSDLVFGTRPDVSVTGGTGEVQ